MMYLFSRISYSINATEIDSIANTGITKAMKRLSSNDLSLNNAGWQIQNMGSNINNQGYFSASIPMNIVMGFFLRL